MGETENVERGASEAVWTPEQIDRLLVEMGRDLLRKEEEDFQQWKKTPVAQDLLKKLRERK